jgi:hypothetical protein
VAIRFGLRDSSASGIPTLVILVVRGATRQAADFFQSLSRIVSVRALVKPSGCRNASCQGASVAPTEAVKRPRFRASVTSTDASKRNAVD